MFWAGAARLVTVIGWMGLCITTVARLVPQVTEFSQIAFGVSDMAGSRIRVIRDGTEVEVNGQLGFGIAEEFQRTLDANPSAHVVHLNSNGGRILEAMALARIIRDRGMVTYVATECLSACVAAFSAGEERWIAHEAVIGLHAPSVPGMSVAEVTAAMADERAFIVGRGVNEAFIERGFSTPNAKMWRPTHEEVFASGLATGYAPVNGVGISGSSARELENLAGELSKLPLYAALAETNPEVYAAIARDFEDGFQRGSSLEDLRAATLPRVVAVYTKSLPHASDGALRRFGDLLVSQGRALQEAEPLKCAALFAGSGGLEVHYALPEELRQRELEVMADVILSAARDPQPTPLLDDLSSQLSEALNAMPVEAHADLSITDDPKAAEAMPDRYCATVIAFYEAILTRPESEAGPLLRALFGDAP